MCPHAYYLTYVLGHSSPSGQKAEQGTIVHKVMECLAAAKKCHQDQTNTFVDDAFGEMTVDYEYMYTDEYIKELIERSIDHYTKSSLHHWQPRHFKECRKWSWDAIEYCNGAFDPRKRNIVEPEGAFNFEIDEDWSNYEYELPSGEALSGKLSMKGTIDLITEVRPGIYEVIDWKTGRRLDWATGKEKTYKKLTTDPQLRIYHYALSKIYPDIEQFIMTIFFIKDGGPYTLSFTKDDMEDTKKMIKKRFQEIKRTKVPSLKKSWKCTRICHFGKNEHPSGEINPKTGNPHTICSYVANKIRKKGMNASLVEDINPNHHFDYYEAPG
tara:strand:+ start:10566 stop:11543 length:978 start_codon:yes stop_codon:yes gene_type:complete